MSTNLDKRPGDDVGSSPGPTTRKGVAAMKRISPSMIIASLALFFSLGGASLAASHYLITSVHQIKPSVRAQLRGAQGPQGLQGIAGPQGAVGPAGPRGLPGISPQARVFATQPSSVAIAPGQPGQAEVACPLGSTLLSGGYTAAPGLNIVASTPVVKVGDWLVQAVNPTDAPLSLTVNVVCMTTASS